MKVDIYQKVTDLIIEQLESGVVPWQKMWSGDGKVRVPMNLTTGKPYRGINPFLLLCKNYSSPYWITFKQAKKLGGRVRKGEKATMVVFWKFIQKTDEETGDADQIPMLRYYNVFNVEQCELPEGAVPESTDETFEHDAIETCEEVVENMPNRPDIKHGDDQAFYRPTDDTVHMPNSDRFKTRESYYSTLFHELSHSTGHKDRLNRKEVANGAKQFGSEEYGREELVAEMSSAFLCATVGIVDQTIDNSAAYIGGWLKVIKKDKRLVVSAAGAAQKSADYILDTFGDSDAE